MPMIRPSGDVLGWVAAATTRRHWHLGRSRFYSSRVSDPLRILFCGSDTFSCESLRALDAVRRSEPQLVKSIDVVTRPPKRTGRGLKVIKHAPIETLATDLELPVHLLDSFRGWEPPLNDGEVINLIVAVSFGLFIPSRILKAVRYGGLNLHPSFLPDLHGSAPIQWAVMLNRQHTGVTLQTLDDKAFDKGMILSQTQRPGISIPPDATTADLTNRLAGPSATMLVDGLRAGLHLPPLAPLAVADQHEKGNPAVHARKLTKQDAEMRWDKLLTGEWSSADVGRRHRALGPLWGRTTSLLPPHRAAAAEEAGAAPSATSNKMPQQPQQQHKKKNRNDPLEPQRVILEGVTVLPDGHSRTTEAVIHEVVGRTTTGLLSNSSSAAQASHERESVGAGSILGLFEVEWEMEPAEGGTTARRYKTFWIPGHASRATCLLVVQYNLSSLPAKYMRCRLSVDSMKMEGQPSKPAFEVVEYLGARQPLPLPTAPTQ